MVIVRAEEGVSADDREAKALLNKFLGASVLMQGIEPLLQAQSSALVSQVEKQRLASAQVSVFTINFGVACLGEIIFQRECAPILRVPRPFIRLQKLSKTVLLNEL
jgi:hypothetical protein